MGLWQVENTTSFLWCLRLNVGVRLYFSHPIDIPASLWHYLIQWNTSLLVLWGWQMLLFPWWNLPPIRVHAYGGQVMNYPQRISVQLEKSPWKLLSVHRQGLTDRSSPRLRRYSTYFIISPHASRALKCVLADRPAPHQKLGFSIKRNAHLCLSLQVTRTDEGPYKSPMGMAVVWGWRQGVAEISSEIYRLLHCGSEDEIRLDATEVNPAHNSYPVAMLGTGRLWW